MDERQKPIATVVDLYRLAVEMADRVSARRATANGFFLAVHAGIITAVGVLHPDAVAAQAARPAAFGPALIAVAGIVLAAAWWLALRSYRDLNNAKFKVITQIEALLPVAVFRDEWEFLKKDPVRSWRTRYAELGQVERVIPLVFLALYVISFVALILNW